MTTKRPKPKDIRRDKEERLVVVNPSAPVSSNATGARLYGDSVTKITKCRETIGGVEVVDAEYADRLLVAIKDLLDARSIHGCAVQQKFLGIRAISQGQQRKFNKKKRLAARLCHQLIYEATGIEPVWQDQ